MTSKKKTEEVVVTEEVIAVDLKIIAIALVSTTLELTRLAPKAGDYGYLQALSEYEVGDLVVNIADVFADEDCLDRVGTVLEIRENEVEIRRLDGLTRCAIGRASTYIAAKGVENA
jgi:hypothetical protein